MSEINWPTFDEWLAELRSPNVGEQAQGKLKAEDGSRCCLGVLCDMAGVESKLVPEMKFHQYDFGDGHFDTASLPSFVHPEWMTFSIQSRAINWNDQGKSFAQIADILEADYDA